MISVQRVPSFGRPRFFASWAGLLVLEKGSDDLCPLADVVDFLGRARRCSSRTVLGGALGLYFAANCIMLAVMACA